MDTGECDKSDLFVESQVVKYSPVIIATAQLICKDFKRLAISGGPGHLGKEIRRGKKKSPGTEEPPQ